MPAPIAVTFALPTESADFVRCLTSRQATGTRGTNCVSGECGGRRIVIVYTGVGKVVARKRVSEFLESTKVALVLSSGFAGALHDGLAPGDLFAAENFSHPQLLARARRLPLHVGRLHTSAGIVDSADERRAQTARTGAEAIDMETEFIAAECGQRGIPMLSLRAISDTPSFPFPAPPSVLFDLENQRTDFPRLGVHLLRHPATALRLITFAKRIAMVRRALADGLRAAVDQLP